MKSLLVDISSLQRMAVHSGVQRVTRSILTEWLNDPPAGWSVRPMVFERAGVRACDAGSVRRACPGFRGTFDCADDAGPAGGRIVFLDLNYEVTECRDWLLAAKAGGARLTFVLYDLLPLHSPQWFPDVVGPLYLQWIEMLAELGDDIACISNAVREEFLAWFRLKSGDRPPPRVRYFPLGSDPFPPCEELPSVVAGALRQRPTALMVSTIEPRKGHAQALDAFEHLWAAGVDMNLLFVGGEGWKIAPLAGRLRAHPEYGRRFFWLENCPDGRLSTCYRDSRVVLVPSFGEGFGLSIVEASRHGCPVIARDLPVFREVAPPGTVFFTGQDPGRLATAILSGIQTRPAVVGPVRLHGWSDSARALFEMDSA